MAKKSREIRTGDVAFFTSAFIESYTGGGIYIDLNDGNGQGGNFADVDIMADTSKVGRKGSKKQGT